MSYIATGFTEEQESEVLESLETLKQRSAETIRRQKEEESRRRWTLLMGGLGALFAAVKLGIVVVPKVRERRMGKL